VPASLFLSSEESQNFCDDGAIHFLVCEEFLCAQSTQSKHKGLPRNVLDPQGSRFWN